MSAANGEPSAVVFQLGTIIGKESAGTPGSESSIGNGEGRARYTYCTEERKVFGDTGSTPGIGNEGEIELRASSSPRVDSGAACMDPYGPHPRFRSPSSERGRIRRRSQS